MDIFILICQALIININIIDNPEVTVKVENKTDPSSNEAQVYDILTYTITATNKEKDTKWKDVGIKNKLPEGLTLVEDSIKLIDPEGKEIKFSLWIRCPSCK